MSVESSRINGAAIRDVAPDLRLAAVEDRMQLPPAELSASAMQLPTGATTSAVADGVAPALLVALLQEYAVHQAISVAARRERRVHRILEVLLGVGGGVAFVGFAVWMVIEFAAGTMGARLRSPEHPPWGVGMFTSAPFALAGFVHGWLAVVQGRKIAAGERSKADVIRRLLAAFPQLQGADAEALLSGKGTQAIMARPANWAQLRCE